MKEKHLLVNEDVGLLENGNMEWSVYAGSLCHQKKEHSEVSRQMPLVQLGILKFVRVQFAPAEIAITYELLGQYI